MLFNCRGGGGGGGRGSKKQISHAFICVNVVKDVAFYFIGYTIHYSLWDRLRRQTGFPCFLQWSVSDHHIFLETRLATDIN